MRSVLSNTKAGRLKTQCQPAAASGRLAIDDCLRRRQAARRDREERSIGIAAHLAREAQHSILGRCNAIGRSRLCYTLKAGDADMPAASDCVVAESCTDAWYMTRDVAQEFPPLPAWTGADPACAERFATSGGYGEMSVTGLSVECDPVDDGSGAPYFFNRVNYCPLSCSMTPTAPECMGCMMGGSGSF
jgi:hypothetical protein